MKLIVSDGRATSAVGGSHSRGVLYPHDAGNSQCFRETHLLMLAFIAIYHFRDIYT